VSLEDLAAILTRGKDIEKKEAVELLKDQTGLGRTACYDALKLEGGEFSEYLDEAAGVIKFFPSARSTI
jgi:hypothetical protein